MVRAQIRVQAEFCAAFRLAQAHLTDAQNRAWYGPCFSDNFHGHNYLLTVVVEGKVPPESGMVADYAVLDAIVAEQVVNCVDHRNLNLEVDFLAQIVPTSENLCIAFWPRIQAALPVGLILRELHLQESRDHGVIYHGPES
jgi:6-pyruvoyltetrahydropterin/6-carboxytetrahydropterin synthase